MSVRARVTFVFLAVFCAGFVVQAQAQEAAPQIEVLGTSTVRNWSCPVKGEVKTVAGKAAPAVPGFPTGVQSVTLTLKVQDFVCDNDQMKEHLLTALKEKTFPTITYKLTSYKPAGAGDGAGRGGRGGGGGTVAATGTITIAGVTKPITLDVTLRQAPDGVHSVGETTLDMTQFGVAPPTLFLGQLKVGKEVRIKFDAVLKP